MTALEIRLNVGMVAHASTQSAEAGGLHGEFKASLNHIVRLRLKNMRTGDVTRGCSTSVAHTDTPQKEHDMRLQIQENQKESTAEGAAAFCLVWFWFFETGFLCVAVAVLELAL